MSYRITCYTLFDITQTGVVNRMKPNDTEDHSEWIHRRNTQCNFDTVVQAISLRSQPESITVPKKNEIRSSAFKNFGSSFRQEKNQAINTWNFDFEIHYEKVFDDGEHELGHLYTDCDRVPMILCGTEWNKLPVFLDTSLELRNIYFKLHNEA